MPNVLLNVTSSKPSIRSGDTVQLVIEYEAIQTGTVEFRCVAPFQIGTESAPLPRSSNGRVTVAMKIDRSDPHGPDRCEILCSFEGSPPLHAYVEIT